MRTAQCYADKIRKIIEHSFQGEFTYLILTLASTLPKKRKFNKLANYAYVLRGKA